MIATHEYLTHDQMNNYYAEIIRRMTVDDFKPDVVMAPMRGGTDFGIKLSYYYGVPFAPLQWQTRDGSAQNKDQLIEYLNKYKDAQILIVDDICDTGETFDGIEKEVESVFGFDATVRSGIRFAAAIENIECGFPCDYAAREIQRSQDTQWFIFPWEEWWSRSSHNG